MIVIVPHPTEELLLIKTQKELIRTLFEPGKIIYAHTPLWITTPFETAEQAKKEITGINVNAPQYEESTKTIVCNIQIETKNGIINGKLDFIDGTLCPCKLQNDKALYPLRINIFRIGECTVNKNIYELCNTSWKKLK